MAEELIQTGERILVATAERGLASEVREALPEETLGVVDSATELLAALREQPSAIVLLHEYLPGLSAERLIQRITQRHVGADIVLLARAGGAEYQDRSLTTGVAEVVGLPLNRERIRVKVRSLLRRRWAIKSCGMVGRSEALYRVAETVIQIAPTNVTVLIQGESGVGKELVARAIHDHSTRRDGPFLPVTCGAIAEGVLESELFGHEKGAFTGAASQRPGMFELADGGTVFLDEIGELAPATQVKLLRVLEEREFMRVGGTRSVTVDVRIVAATNRDLERETATGSFRRDLYYRINVVSIEVPPLRQRKDDIPLLAREFALRFAKENGVPLAGISPAGVDRLVQYDWPGNVRELRNVVESFVALAGDQTIGEDQILEALRGRGRPRLDLPVHVGRDSHAVEHEMIYRALVALREEVASLRQILEGPGHFAKDRRPVESSELKAAERELILRTVNETGGNRREAARRLGISERTLYRRLREYADEDSDSRL
jgi:DNA-binding NtrC family response regulator